MPKKFEAYEFNTHVFVVKIWLEEFHNDDQGVWRGHITHVPSGERRYIDGFLDLISFIIPYLTKMKARINWFWRYGEFIKHRQRRNKVNHSRPLPEETEHRSDS